MVAKILRFPQIDARCVDRGDDQPGAVVYAFPSARQLRIIRFVGRRMAACASIDDARNELIEHLQIQAQFLDDVGISDDAAEADLRGFARAAWALWERLRSDNGAGVA